VTRDAKESNSKSQAPSTKQIPNANDRMTQTKKSAMNGLLFGTLEFGIYLEFGFWCLGF
jgi:hypothetical protein